MKSAGQTAHPLSEHAIGVFIQSHQLPDDFRGLIADYYLPLASWVVDHRTPNATMLLGINGAQGTGKSTLAEVLKLTLETQQGWCVAVLSIDDFYLTKAERLDLADKVHPLLETRGVPGTHDVEMLSRCIDGLRGLAEGEEFRLPRFDKAQDDRAPDSRWPLVSGPVDLIVLEGWCVGSLAQDDAAIGRDINDLERSEDPTGQWRRYANDRLRSDYEPLFAGLDALIFLQAPGFDAIFRWRLEQEAKLAESAPADASGIMDKKQVADFIQLYERITRSNLQRLPQEADVVFELNEHHHIVAARYRD